MQRRLNMSTMSVLKSKSKPWLYVLGGVCCVVLYCVVLCCVVLLCCCVVVLLCCCVVVLLCCCVDVHSIDVCVFCNMLCIFSNIIIIAVVRCS